MERTTRQTKLCPDKNRGKEMKRVAEGKPIVRVVEVAHPVQVRFALRVVPPHIARLLIALEGLYERSSAPPPIE